MHTQTHTSQVKSSQVNSSLAKSNQVKSSQSAEASGLWACRGLARGSVPPILQSSNPGGGFTLPLPPPWRLGSEGCWRVVGGSESLRAPQTASRRSKTAPRRLQDGSRTLQDGSKTLQDTPRRAQDVPRHPRDAPNTPKTPSRHPQDASKTRCWWIWKPKTKLNW